MKSPTVSTPARHDPSAAAPLSATEREALARFLRAYTPGVLAQLARLHPDTVAKAAEGYAVTAKTRAALLDALTR